MKYVPSIKLIAMFVGPALALHFLFLFSIPGFIMARVNAVMDAEGLPYNQFIVSERSTPQNQPVVRPSPDLAYSMCRFDVSSEPVLVKGAKWDSYGSIAVFDSRTNNVFASSLDENSGEPGAVILKLNSQSTANSAIDAQIPVVTVSNPQGVVLIRRLAPTQEEFDRSRELGVADICTELSKYSRTAAF